MASGLHSVRQLTPGTAQGPVLSSDLALSFWGGVDPASGEVIDRHHPLSGQCITGHILALPSGRGSCTGSSVLLQLILNGRAPLALVLASPDEILVLGAIVAEVVFGHQLPILCLGPGAFAELRGWSWASLQAGGALTGRRGAEAVTLSQPPGPAGEEGRPEELQLSAQDQAILGGSQGRARQVAMGIVQRLGRIQGAAELIDVERAHIDGCIYTGEASLRFARQLRDWGGRVAVPTTLNAISVDQRRWRAQGVDPAFGEAASELAQCYVDMGAQPTFTCAPYLLEHPPERGEQIAWAESNAVVFANSVLGARTVKYADFMDICIALVGRAPKAGCHLEAPRRATLLLQLPELHGLDDAFYPLLGYLAGLLAGDRIPVLAGLEEAHPSRDDLKAFGAAFATTGSAPMFHMVQVTPEAPTVAAALGGRPAEEIRPITVEDLARAWRELSQATDARVELVALGNPHFSVAEFERLAELCRGRRRHAETAFVVTTSRTALAEASRCGYVAPLEAFGAEIITDTCWCMLGEPIVPPLARTLMTNSAKYAHYAAGLTGRQVHFGSLAACVEAGATGRASGLRPPWLEASPRGRTP
jgi:cis-L-3-hydroxyproline dehydratase